jgi:hypothetical protein
MRGRFSLIAVRCSATLSESLRTPTQKEGWFLDRQLRPQLLQDGDRLAS